MSKNRIVARTNWDPDGLSRKEITSTKALRYLASYQGRKGSSGRAIRKTRCLACRYACLKTEEEKPTEEGGSAKRRQELRRSTETGLVTSQDDGQETKRKRLERLELIKTIDYN